jgi:hypothetical protein
VKLDNRDRRQIQREISASPQPRNRYVRMLQPSHIHPHVSKKTPVQKGFIVHTDDVQQQQVHKIGSRAMTGGQQ